MVISFSTATNCVRDRRVVQFWQMKHNKGFLREFLEKYFLLLRNIYERKWHFLMQCLEQQHPLSYEPDYGANTNYSETQFISWSYHPSRSPFLWTLNKKSLLLKSTEWGFLLHTSLYVPDKAFHYLLLIFNLSSCELYFGDYGFN